MRIRKTTSFIAAATIALAVGAGLVYGFHLRRTEPVDRLVIAEPAAPISAIVYVALDRGYFRDEGLLVELQPQPSGKDSLQAVLTGRADLALASEVPLVAAMDAGTKFSIIAMIESSDRDNFIIARKDRGISTPPDLADKTIGMSAGTSGQSFLETFWIANRLPPNRLRMVPVSASQTAQTLADGDVDAVSTWAMYRLAIDRLMSDKVIVFEGRDVFFETWNLAANSTLVEHRPHAIAKFLRALLAACEALREDPQQARDLTARRSGVPAPALAELWDSFRFGVTLDRILLMTLENQARLSARERNGFSPPRVRDYIHVDGLRSVAPTQVRLVSD
jgi:NitT/TauT family transport system substrate-binding protein